jgi:hypothetical protein
MTNNHLYSNLSQRIDTVFGSQNFLYSLHLAKKEYDALTVPDSFFAWMLDYYGVELHFEDGVIMAVYSVVDERKFMMFALRYMQ